MSSLPCLILLFYYYEAPNRMKLVSRNPVYFGKWAQSEIDKHFCYWKTNMLHEAHILVSSAIIK